MPTKHKITSNNLDAYPALYRFATGDCQRCGRHSDYLVMVAFLLRGQFDRACLTCARCRCSFERHWRVAKGWQEEPVREAAETVTKSWKEWVAANPPLEEEFEDDE